MSNGRCLFRVWAPKAKRVELELVAPERRLLSMAAEDDGYFCATVDRVSAGIRYLFRIDGETSLPDPASRHQPDGVHEPSEVVDFAFHWSDTGRCGRKLTDYILYELHVGTFTEDGTFDAAVAHLDELRDLGITAIELMPVAQFPGNRNWGYDGVYPFAVQSSYGGPLGLKRFVNACHARGLAVVLDVVYNHLGPEGNYLGQFGHYFSDEHRTPWGSAINFDGPGNREVRRFFVENALYWITECHIDALRLDAVHAIVNQTDSSFLRELAAAVRLRGRALNRQVYLIAESNLNHPRMIQPRDSGGYGLDAQCLDDLRYSIHTALTDDRFGDYEDFAGFPDVVQTYRDGFVYTGENPRHRVRRHDQLCLQLPATSFVVCSQNHDHVGNRMLGERLSELVDFERLKLAAGVVLLSPYIPLLFMGEEYGETRPFQFFVSYGDSDLADAARRGRRTEFARYRWVGEPPDPQQESTFRRCKLNHRLRLKGQHAVLRDFYRTLIVLRRSNPALAYLSRKHMEIRALATERIMTVRRWANEHQVVAVHHFGNEAAEATISIPAGRWHKCLDSAERRWMGSGSVIPKVIESSGQIAVTLAAHSFAVFECEGKTEAVFGGE